MFVRFIHHIIHHNPRCDRTAAQRAALRRAAALRRFPAVPIFGAPQRSFILLDGPALWNVEVGAEEFPGDGTCAWLLAAFAVLASARSPAPATSTKAAVNSTARDSLA